MFSPRMQRSLRHIHSSAPRASHVGGSPVYIPPSVSLRIQPSRLEISGPLGSQSLVYPPFLSIGLDEATNKATVTVQNPGLKEQRSMWGTVRALFANHVNGVSEGHIVLVRLIGVGYRASVENEGKIISLKIGFSSPVELPVPAGIKVSCPQPARIVLEGIDKNVVTQFAAKIRSYRKPSSYKGKGIFVGDETIAIKQKK